MYIAFTVVFNVTTTLKRKSQENIKTISLANLEFHALIAPICFKSINEWILPLKYYYWSTKNVNHLYEQVLGCMEYSVRWLIDTRERQVTKKRNNRNSTAFENTIKNYSSLNCVIVCKFCTPPLTPSCRSNFSWVNFQEAKQMETGR